MLRDQCEYRYKALEEGTVVSPAEDSDLEEGMEEPVQMEGSVSTV